MTIFDLPASRLNDLADDALRELVARLCEGERERSGGHRSEVRWGGAQTAPDGGLDVSVEAQSSFESTPVLPRRTVGIQVKKSDLSRSGIVAEMCPRGTLRESIQELARQGGAYLIVSVGADCSRSMLDDRQGAMRDAVGTHPGASALHTDFIDRHALARWVSAHPSVSLWLRERLGLPTLRGWVGYSRWSSTPEGIDDTLICGDGLRFRLPGPSTVKTVPEALDAIRTLVRDGKKAIRIAGLSGIGKTRLAQSLFEHTGVSEPLPASWAVYTDVGREPDPLPLPMLETLIASNAPAVLIIDNCPPDTHRVLAERLAKSASRLRLITIEYDVRDDRPEETEVVQIEAEGPEIVEALIRRRYPGRSPEDARRLAELALGNARLALALAAASPETGSLSSFDDNALFRRLFWQREQADPQFEHSAEALSLVYSFDVEGVETPDELRFLSEVTDAPRLTLHRHSTVLVERGLAQARGRWRAILPHALANRLARRAMRSLPWRELATAFAHPEASRLRRSFARRLAYLHDLPDSRQIVLQWMQDGGPLSATQDFTEYDLALLGRVCHLVPAEALEHLRQLVDRSSSDRELRHRLDQVTRLLVRLAYTPDHFDNAVRALVDLVIATEDREAANVDHAIESLFGLYLSGTLARTDQRVDAARAAVFAEDLRTAKRGLVMLRAALKTSMWSSSFLSTDDARPNAYGWHPRGTDVVEWFHAWLALAEEAALGAHEEIRAQANEILAMAVSSVWHRVPQLRDGIEEIAARLSTQSPWVEGWNALRRRRSLNVRRAPDDDQLGLDRLSALILALEPKGLLDRTRAVLRSKGYFDEEPEGDSPHDHETAMRRHSARLREIGEELAARPDVIDAVGAELFAARHNNPIEIGHGLGAVSLDPRRHWQQLRDIYLTAPERTRSPSLLSGFLAAVAERCPDLADKIRDECLRTPALRQIYAAFGPFGCVSNSELERLREAASDPEVWAEQFGEFVWRDRHGLTDAERIHLLSSMLAGKSGPEAVIHALGMLRHVEQESPRDWPHELRSVGINAVTSVILSNDDRLDDNLDYHAAEVVQKCLLPSDEVAARRLVDAVVAHAGRRYGSLYDLEWIVAALAERSPAIFLDHALAVEDVRFRLGHDATFDRSPLAGVEPQALIDWCRMGGLERWIAVAKAIQPFGPGDDAAGQSGSPALSAQAMALLEAAPEAEPVVSAFTEDIAPASWSGSRATIMEGRLSALEQLSDHPNEMVRQAFERHATELRRMIERQRERELSEDRERDVSFE